ncbi:NAD-binding protein [Polaribacter sp. Q13]|uniref:NAD-binding protein n=1 Tax=Polaribacter sp. Q13 TaxID=2806551 RepID=UPI00193B8D67|nr:NAD(P)-dependent oxidoreductase [Polaribacter sp. Q13]
MFYLGTLGAGHTTKLINNFMGMTTVVAMSQAFAAAKLGSVDGQQLFDIMSSRPSNSPFMKFCKNYAVDNVSDLGSLLQKNFWEPSDCFRRRNK